MTIKIKIQQRLNKLASQDYDNIQDWQIVEAFNKGTVDWCRRQLHGTNLTKTGDEQSKRRIDDLQVLLREYNLNMDEEDCYFGSANWPENYFEFKRVSFKANTDCCESNKFIVYLAEEENVDILLRDPLRKPNFEWRTTFLTLANNIVKIWTNNEFDISEATLHYYKQPRRIEMLGVANPYTGIPSTVEVISEFKDDIVEVIIEEAVKILAGDHENIASNQIAEKSVEQNN
ncbi:MAG: hypothetical protein GTO02_04640 [Candidatus Dadabacteria bacterium]|nr:hypothetical protein [Candidatus Dadabacteria bacterium]